MTDAIDYLETHLPPFWLGVVRLAVWLVLLAVIFVPVERLWAAHRQKIARKSLAADLGYYFLNSILPGMLLSVPIALAALAGHRYLPWGFQAFVAELPLWARVTLVMLVAETGFYWGHRWSHQVPLLWRFHAIHHSPEQIDWLVNTRAHPFDMVFTRFCGLTPVYLLGLAQPVGSAAAFGLLPVILTGTVWGFFIHANLRWRFGWLEQIISTPAFHHWHHTQDEHRDHNYAAMLPWLDRVFGTYYMPRHGLPAEYGIDSPISPDFASQLLLDPFTPRAVPSGRTS